MSKQDKATQCRITKLSAQPASLAGDYLRGLAAALSKFGEFDQFLDCLKQLVGDDVYLTGSAVLSDPFAGPVKSPDFENFTTDETVVAVAGEVGNLGYLKYSGRGDGSLLGAEDLHLMGALAGLIAVLIRQAHRSRQQSKAEQILQYLINQLPLGVVCLDSNGGLVVESSRARRLLGDSDLSIFDEVLKQQAHTDEGAQVHFDIDGRLLYCESRSIEVAEGDSVFAFILHDMSALRSKLWLDLDREAYRSESRETPVTIAVVELLDKPGEAYALLQQAVRPLDLELDRIQPLDAYRSVCLFDGRRPPEVRGLLSKVLPAFSLDELRVSIVSYTKDLQSAEPAKMWLDRAIGELQPCLRALRPKLIVLDNYSSVYESLEMILSEKCQLIQVGEFEDAVVLLEQGGVDGIFYNLDTFGPELLQHLKSLAKSQGFGFQFYYSTCKRRSMIDPAFGLGGKDVCLLKPFDAQEVSDAVDSVFSLA